MTTIFRAHIDLFSYLQMHNININATAALWRWIIAYCNNKTLHFCVMNKMLLLLFSIYVCYYVLFNIELVLSETCLDMKVILWYWHVINFFRFYSLHYQNDQREQCRFENKLVSYILEVSFETKTYNTTTYMLFI